MANIKVSELTEAVSFEDEDYTMIIQGNQNKKISKENMFDKDIYSLQEVKTNKVWIDGKPIYRKVISVNSPSSAGVYTSIANMGSNVVDTLVSATSMILVNYTANNQVFYNLNVDEGDTNHYCLIAYNRSNGNIQAKVGTEFISKKINIILEYTKTNN